MAHSPHILSKNFPVAYSTNSGVTQPKMMMPPAQVTLLSPVRLVLRSTHPPLQKRDTFAHMQLHSHLTFLYP